MTHDLPLLKMLPETTTTQPPGLLDDRSDVPPTSPEVAAMVERHAKPARQAMADNFPEQTQEAARAWVRRYPKATAGEAATAFRLRDAYHWFQLLHGGPA